GSAIVAPDMRVIAGPMSGDEEGILYADMDFDIGVKLKLRHDLAGHYNRPDVFRLLVNKNPAPLLETYRGPDGRPELEGEHVEVMELEAGD
ncbi:MAG: hypothetical protein JSV07_04515, partial [Acidimicrobiia bacterium]